MVKKKDQVEEEEEEGGMSLDDAFGDDDDVEYAAESKPKPKKPKKKKVKAEKVVSSSGDDSKIKFKMSKSIKEIKKGDKLKVDGVEMEVDAHYILMKHEGGNEMTLEIFNAESDEDYQLRYFEDRFEDSAEFFKLDEIVYQRESVSKIEW
jgi:hypothetical protein